MAFHPYLNFDGNCREAFARYHEIFGGDLQMMGFSDVPEGEDVPPGMDGMVANAALVMADGGSIEMAIEEVFWSPRFGICVDRFGTPWMVNAAPSDG